MSKPVLRLICLVLVLALGGAVLASCGSTETPAGETQTGTSAETDPETSASPETGEPRLKPDIPETYDFGGESVDFLCWFLGSWQNTVRTYRDIATPDLTSDLVNDAVFERNKLIEDNYKVSITMRLVDLGDVSTIIKNQVAVGGGEDAYEVCYPRLLEFPGFFKNDIVQDITLVPNIDLSKPWWDQDSIENLTVVGVLPLVATALNVNDKDATAALAFNKQAAKDRGITTLYDEVADMEWTVESLMGYCQAVGDPDSNGDGNGTADMEDFWAFLGKNDVSTSFFHGIGGKIAKTGEDGKPVFTAGDPISVEAMEQVVQFMNEPYFFNHHAAHIGSDVFTRMFETNHGLFFWMRLDEVTAMRGSEVEFGILPTPMYTAEQNQYYSTVSQHTTGLLSIPKDISGDTLNMTGMILEALAADSYYGLQHAYVDLSLKTKYSSDEESRESLNTILSSRVFDPGIMYNLGGFGTEIQNLGPNKESLATKVREYTDKVNSAIRELVEFLSPEE